MTAARERGMSVWQSPSGVWHWLRGCTGGGGRHRMRRVTVTRAQWAAAVRADTTTAGPGTRCRCAARVDFTPGRRAR